MYGNVTFYTGNGGLPRLIVDENGKVDLAGELKLGTGATACAAGAAGLMRFNSATNLPEACVSKDAGTTWEWMPMTQNVLTANRVYYVRTDGSNANNGLANTAGGAFLTIQKAIDTVTGLDLNNYDVTIKLADGTYTTPVVVNKQWRGRGVVSILGNVASPQNVVVSTTGHAITVTEGARLQLSGFEIRTSTSGIGLYAYLGGQISLDAAMRFGPCADYHMAALIHGSIVATSDYTIAGGATSHIFADRAGLVQVANVTTTLSGTPAFSGAFARADIGGIITIYGNTYSGAATGSRYSVNTNSNIVVNGAGGSYLPGNAVGTTSSGGQYN